MYFPTPTALLGLTGRFCLAAGGGQESSWTAATAKPTPTLIRKLLVFLPAGMFGGALRPSCTESSQDVRLSALYQKPFVCAANVNLDVRYFTDLEMNALLFGQPIHLSRMCCLI